MVTIAWAASCRVAHLCTLRPDGSPHIVPIVFVIDDDVLWSPIDGKRKQARRLVREHNVRNDARASVLFDHYAEDWQHLAWLRLDGGARVVDATAQRDHFTKLLTAKYPQYASTPPFAEPPRLLRFTWQRVSAWQATPGLL